MFHDGPAPLILTLRFDAMHQALFDRLREAHFPPERNVLKAHVTLFHALPGADQPSIDAALERLAVETAAPEVTVAAPFSLGGGVAFRLDAPAALALRDRLARRWAEGLTAQDAAAKRLHVTVQNKVRPAEARALLADLAPGFQPSRFTSPGLDLWRYLGSPWAHVRSYDFAS